MRVIIVGGGFAAVQFAKTLRRKLRPAECEILLFNRERLSELLPANPVYVALEDSALVAYATMLDHDVAWLPVAQSKDNPRPVGCVRQERIGNLIIQRMGEKERARAAS
jgi:hypothetical protein